MALPFRNVFFAEVEAKTNLTRCSPSKNCRLILQTCSPACNYFSAPPSSVFFPDPLAPFFYSSSPRHIFPFPANGDEKSAFGQGDAADDGDGNNTDDDDASSKEREREIELGRKKRNGVRKSASWLRPGGEPWVGPPPLLRTPHAPVRLSRFSVRTDTDAEKRRRRETELHKGGGRGREKRRG